MNNWEQVRAGRGTFGCEVPCGGGCGGGGSYVIHYIVTPCGQTDGHD